MLKAILVDFDGTFVDSIAQLYQFYQKFLNHYGVQGTLKEFQELNGPKLNEIVQMLMERHHLQVSQQILLARYLDLLYGFYTKEALPFPQAVDQLKTWAAKGVRLVLVTSAHADLVNAFIKAHDLYPLFEFIVTSQEVQKGKPDPAIYQVALEKLGVSSEEAIAIEDSQNGLLSARGAGLLTILLHAQTSDTPEVVPIKDWEEWGKWMAVHYA